MIFKNLYINIVTRILLIVISCLAFPFLNEKYNDIVINANIVAVIIIQIILLIRRLNFMNRDLISFLDSIKYDDSSIILSNAFQSQDYFRLSKRLQKVNKQILKLKEQNLQKDLYFKTVTEHATVGLLSYDSNGSVKLCNGAFKNLFNINALANINELNQFNSECSKVLLDIQPNEQKMLHLKLKDKNLNLTIHATHIISKSESLKLVSAQDIKNELDEKELESWQKLVQILRHEIMNSIAPISSTIDTLYEIITNPENNEVKNLKELNDEIIEDIASGLKIIKERNVGIEAFIDQFRSLSKIPEPNLSEFNLNDFFTGIKLLMDVELNKGNISINWDIDPESKTVLADKTQLEQVFINLVKNSIEALSNTKNATIDISCKKTNTGKTEIQIKDNGTGINSEELESIFLPFFTTKEQGSGIGLSLVRQIIRLHGGNIQVESIPNKETVFTINL